jgi:toxin ParE1/3/4
VAEVRWSAGALRDLDAIGAHLAATSERYARALVGRLFEAGAGLGAFPNLGRVVPEVEVDHIREIIRDGYRLVYLADDERVEVLAVLHSRQDLQKALRRE